MAGEMVEKAMEDLEAENRLLKMELKISDSAVEFWTEEAEHRDLTIDRLCFVIAFLFSVIILLVAL